MCTITSIINKLTKHTYTQTQSFTASFDLTDISRTHQAYTHTHYTWVYYEIQLYSAITFRKKCTHSSKNFQNRVIAITIFHILFDTSVWPNTTIRQNKNQSTCCAGWKSVCCCWKYSYYWIKSIYLIEVSEKLSPKHACHLRSIPFAQHRHASRIPLMVVCLVLSLCVSSFPVCTSWMDYFLCSRRLPPLTKHTHTEPTTNRWPCCLLSHSSLMGRRWMSPHLCLPECLVCPDSYLHCHYYNLWMSHVDSKPQWLTCFSLLDPSFMFAWRDSPGEDSTPLL